MDEVRSIITDAKNFYRPVFRFLSKGIPKFILGLFAVFGMVCVGIVFGYTMAMTPIEETENQRLMTENKNLHELISGYEELADVYRDQYDVVWELTDAEKMTRNSKLRAEKVEEADYYRDLILVQYGRLYELRKKAGLPEVKFQEDEMQEEASLL